jgi:DNA-binding NtrC family response regulator
LTRWARTRPLHSQSTSRDQAKILRVLQQREFGRVGGNVESLPLRALLAEVERRAIQHALLACGGNRTMTARRLGISRRQLFDKIREYDLHP